MNNLWVQYIILTFVYTITIKQTDMKASELRLKVSEMTKEEFVIMRDELESNWNNDLRPLMQILSLACIKRFNVTLSTI